MAEEARRKKALSARPSVDYAGSRELDCMRLSASGPAPAADSRGRTWRNGVRLGDLAVMGPDAPNGPWLSRGTR